MYTHCGTTVWVEAIPTEVQKFVVKGDGQARPSDLHDKLEVQPQNNFTAEEKLEMAMTMAEAIADLHGFQDGIMYVSIFLYMYIFLFVCLFVCLCMCIWRQNIVCSLDFATVLCF